MVESGGRAARRVRELLRRVEEVRNANTQNYYGAFADERYAAAFRDAGWDPDGLSAEEFAARVRPRGADVAVAVADALDHWAFQRREKVGDLVGAKRLVAATRVLDPDPWRARLRDVVDRPFGRERNEALQALADATDPAEVSPAGIQKLGASLIAVDDLARAERLLGRAVVRHPSDLSLRASLGSAYMGMQHHDRAVEQYQAARALRPNAALVLFAMVLQSLGRQDEAIQILQQVTTRGNLVPRAYLGDYLKGQGRTAEGEAVLDEVIEACREAVRDHPDRIEPHWFLSTTLRSRGRPEEATAAAREWVRSQPNQGLAHWILGNDLSERGRVEEAIIAYREAVRLRPHSAFIHSTLGDALRRLGRLDEAAAVYRELIRLRPDNGQALSSLGEVLRSVDNSWAGCGDWAKSIAP